MLAACLRVYVESCSASPAPMLQNPFMFSSPHFNFPIWFLSPLRQLFLGPKIPYPYILSDLCENPPHFGPDHGGLRFCSNGNCSLWLSARYVILSPTLCSRWWMWETQGCGEWSEGALLRSLMSPLIRLMRLLWMRRGFHSLPFVLWLLYPAISHLSETKEVQLLQNGNDFHCHSPDSDVYLNFVVISESSINTSVTILSYILMLNMSLFRGHSRLHQELHVQQQLLLPQ